MWRPWWSYYLLNSLLETVYQLLVHTSISLLLQVTRDTVLYVLHHFSGSSSTSSLFSFLTITLLLHSLQNTCLLSTTFPSAAFKRYWDQLIKYWLNGLFLENWLYIRYETYQFWCYNTWYCACALGYLVTCKMLLYRIFRKFVVTLFWRLLCKMRINYWWLFNLANTKLDREDLCRWDLRWRPPSSLSVFFAFYYSTLWNEVGRCQRTGRSTRLLRLA